MFKNRDRHEATRAHAIALECLSAGIAAARPATVVAERVSYEPRTDRLHVDGTEYDISGVERVVVLGGGNAAGEIVTALEDVLGGRIADGTVVTDAPTSTSSVSTLPGDHPVPSQAGVDSTRELLSTAERVGSDDLVLAVIGGGGSALMVAPRESVPLEALRDLTASLLETGASIDEINAVRKHLSRVKGGQLARAAKPARVVGLVISDVVGDDLGVVASGPTAPDSSTYADAIAVLDRYDVTAPAAVRETLERGTDGERPETPGPDSDVFDGITNHVIANAETAIDAAAERALESGYEPTVLSSLIQGEGSEVGRVLAAVGEECARSGRPVEPPAVLLSGGETTVTVRGDGTGGPNQELALAAALAFETDGVVLGSVDTDGLDGSTDAAGALVDAATVSDADRADRALRDNDAYPYLADRQGLLITGETGTNVNDLRVLVVTAAE
jgi:glycerate 2-kinase